jgi:hypothetical protein
MVQSSLSMQRFFLASVASLGLLAAAGPALANTAAQDEAIKTATAACLDSAGKQGWRSDLAKVISSRAIDADKVEVVFDLTKDGTNTARLTCPYSLSKGVADTFGVVISSGRLIKSLLAVFFFAFLASIAAVYQEPAGLRPQD